MLKPESEIKKRIAFLNKQKIYWKQAGLDMHAKAYEKAVEELEWVLKD